MEGAASATPHFFVNPGDTRRLRGTKERHQKAR